MEHGRDEEAEEVLGDIILAGGDVLSYLNDNDGLEEQGEEAGYGDRRVEEERHDYDGSVLGNEAEIQNFLRITKINLWSNLATRGRGVNLHTLVDRDAEALQERG